MTYKTSSSILMNWIYNDQYYSHLLDKALIRHNMSTASIDQHEFSERELCRMWNTFWVALPDSPHVRTGPFFEVCRLAEGIFNDE
jgi:hypothetical protein